MLSSMRRFNTAGPVRPALHYHIPPLDRINLPEVLELIRAEQYFVLHAPRQTGKTSALLALRDLLNGGHAGDYRCAYINVETAQTAREDVGQAMGAIAAEIALEAGNTLHDAATAQVADGFDSTGRPHAALRTLLDVWTRAAPSPLVLLIDEVDAMVGDSLVSLLRQLRAGYVHRPEGFPQSVVLCGVRDVRDYRIRAGSEREVITGGSAFNIKAKSLRMGDFDRAEVEDLLGQHTAETGQDFAPGALRAVWEQTRGQPWLVNALALEMCFAAGVPKDPAGPLAERDVFEAREALILRRETHLDQLADKLREPRVRRVIEPLLSGARRRVRRPRPGVRERPGAGGSRFSAALRQPDLRRGGAPGTHLGAAGPHTGAGRMVRPPRRPPSTWTACSPPFRTSSGRTPSIGSGGPSTPRPVPQLVLQAFLHRVVNATGRIEREYALGSRRVDLLVVWPREGGPEDRIVVECKLVKAGRSLSRTVEEGLDQTRRYMDISGADAGHLVVFDMREGRSWAERVYREERVRNGVPITVWGA